jgi:uncharacterized membrane protein YidH (DUF202 family)
MAGQSDPNVLGAEARTRQRDQAAAELVRALLLINGGGAAVLLAFLQAIWKEDKALANTTIWTLVALSVGAGLTALFHLCRYRASVHYQRGDSRRGEKFARFYNVAASLSLLAFGVGIIMLAIGSLNALTRRGDGASEDIGSRLRDECVSITNQVVRLNPEGTWDPKTRDQFVLNCILKRARVT